MGDLLRFVTIYAVFIMGFSQGKISRHFKASENTMLRYTFNYPVRGLKTWGREEINGYEK